MLVLPGLAANDLTTLPMRTFLKDRGYDALPWEQGLNLGPRAGVLEALRERVRALHAIDGARISLSAGAWAASTRARSPRRCPSWCAA